MDNGKIYSILIFPTFSYSFQYTTTPPFSDGPGIVYQEDGLESMEDVNPVLKRQPRVPLHRHPRAIISLVWPKQVG